MIGESWQKKSNTTLSVGLLLYVSSAIYVCWITPIAVCHFVLIESNIYFICIGSSGSWCPKIYFNYRCFTGPYLSKGRLVLLPQFVGPGPVVLVLKEVLSMLINVAYKPSRVLRELQLDGPQNPNMHQQVLQAK